MNRSNRCWICIFIIITGLIAEAGTASAHPHVWVNATSQIMYAEDGSINGIQHAWTFDDMFSTYAVQAINAKKKIEVAKDQLAGKEMLVGRYYMDRRNFISLGAVMENAHVLSRLARLG